VTTDFDSEPRGTRGFSLLEVLFVVAIIGVISGIAVPMMANSLGFYRLDGDARSLKNAILTARMQAAANFSQARLYLDYTQSAYHTETRASATSPWVAQVATTYLSSRTEAYGFGSVATPPPNTPTPIMQAAPCLDNSLPPVAVPNTSCIIFNSRGIPIDTTGAPTAAYALYLTDGASVYGVTVSATSAVNLYKTAAKVSPAWIGQ
jgi:prepilin-type N-terminal cleavage/methylation domain-containing protein